MFCPCGCGGYGGRRFIGLDALALQQDNYHVCLSFINSGDNFLHIFTGGEKGYAEAGQQDFLQKSFALGNFLWDEQFIISHGINLINSTFT
ncbi:MAG: hypothetical protein Tsb0015_06430 [Simkaniaceae bacterium]